MAITIRKIEEFIVDGLGTVTVHTPINGNEATVYRGKTVLGFTLPDQPPVQLPLEFDITDAASVEDAFAKFEDAAKAQFERDVKATSR
jgi:hypothetical protein